MLLAFCFLSPRALAQNSGQKRQDAARTPASPNETSEAEGDEVYRVDTNLVSIPVIVSDRRDIYIPDMQKEEFTVFEDGVKQEIAFFGTTTKPFNVILMIDTSASAEEKLSMIQQSAIAFIKQLQPSDKVKVISFDDEIRDLNEFTSDRRKIENSIRQTRPGKGAKLYDAMQLALNSFAQTNGRKAIVIFTDGVDFHSDGYRYADSLRKLDESGVIVYPIRYDTRAGTERLARQQAREGQRIDLGTILGGGQSGGRDDGQAGGQGRGGTPTTFPGGTVPGRSGGSGEGIFGLPVPPVTVSCSPRPDPRDDPRNDPRDPNRPTVGFPDGRSDPTPPYPSSRDDSISRMLDALYRTADAYLQDLALKSGGKLTRAGTLAALPDAFKSIAAELRTQYYIGYYPSNPVSNGGYRKVKIKTACKGAIARARPGYTAVAASNNFSRE